MQLSPDLEAEAPLGRTPGSPKARRHVLPVQHDLHRGTIYFVFYGFNKSDKLLQIYRSILKGCECVYPFQY